MHRNYVNQLFVSKYSVVNSYNHADNVYLTELKHIAKYSVLQLIGGTHADRPLVRRSVRTNQLVANNETLCITQIMSPKSMTVIYSKLMLAQYSRWNICIPIIEVKEYVGRLYQPTLLIFTMVKYIIVTNYNSKT